MQTRLASRLVAARRRRFVGRGAQRALFRCALSSDELPFLALYVTGPGGIGKTALLNEFYHQCSLRHIPALKLDAHQIEASPPGFLAALRQAAVVGAHDAYADPWLGFLRSGRRRVLFIDTYELLAPLDHWLREDFLPELPDGTLLVFAGRDALASEWLSDPGWEGLLKVVALANLEPAESRRYLVRRNVAVEQHARVLQFTHGHPLALSLVADVFAQRPGINFEPEAAPDVVKTLLEQFVQKVPGPAHRAALEACSLVRVLTESVLSEMLAMPDAHDLFEWLRGLSFIESEAHGLFPHDLARETLWADLRWRNPDWYAELHRRARGYYLSHVQQSRGQTQQRLLMDYVYLHRDNAVLRPFYRWQDSGTMFADLPHPADRRTLVDVVAGYEGQESADLAGYWLDRQPQGVLALHCATGALGEASALLGFMVMVRMHAGNVAEMQRDEATAAALAYLLRHSPLRSGEHATYFRFWMGSDSYQAVSAAQSALFINMMLHYLMAPGLAFSFVPCADPAFWSPLFAYLRMERLAEADFSVGSRRYGVYGHDWRREPPLTWLATLESGETGLTAHASAPPRAAEALVVLSEREFSAAVHDALRDLARPELLHSNPLIRSRVVAQRAAPGQNGAGRVAALRRVLTEAVEALAGAPREAKLYRALHSTYVEPALTQERAAEALDLPFSTYRRHLKEGIDRVAHMLWQQEIGAL